MKYRPVLCRSDKYVPLSDGLATKTLYLQVSSADNFANSLDPDQARQNVGPDLDPNSLILLLVFLKEFFKKVDFENDQQMTNETCKISQEAMRYSKICLKGPLKKNTKTGFQDRLSLNAGQKYCRMLPFCNTLDLH